MEPIPAEITQVDDIGPAFNVTIDSVMFTADKVGRDWGLAYNVLPDGRVADDNWQGIEVVADYLGMESSQFWPHFKPLLDAAVGW
ncbi:hypothetical protein [Parachitinimonas caeni]|uniref:Uncharacterized protein n=1 Tax=Parachitinimonas caeni TaxID=3031301 RepID=A0ABT7E1P8_9NEIS|nr:hypothetical protein [Parachitinimonas caeni]MDK2126240.1 hypothetical protein [Parachitinimonas caeni]